MAGTPAISGKKQFRFEPGLLLICITILVITGFQAYWLSNNYTREKKILQQKTNITFRETIMKLQAESLPLHQFFNDSTSNINIDISSDSGGPVKIRVARPESVSGLINAIGEKVEDSLKKIEKINSTVILSSEKKDLVFHDDSARSFRFQGKGDPGERFISFLYRVDSLQDSVRISTADSALRVNLSKDKINVPFSIIRHEGAAAGPATPENPVAPLLDARATRRMRELPDNNRVTIGFLHPVTYELQLGNTFPYLLRRMFSPLMFSLFLVGVTILSLVFLYRNLQKQRRLAMIKNDFISNVTHELKTPIATVGVAIEALRNFNALNDPQRTKEYLDISHNELNRLSMLVDKVLKLSMFENHTMELRKESFDLAEVVREVMNSFQLQFEKRGATCKLELEGSDFMVQADKLHLTSVIYNLVDNALKYSPENPHLDIRLKEGAGSVRLSVSDKGVGIPAVYKTKIFDKFFRVPAGDTHNVKGYGLGLSYVAEVVAKHGGTVTVETEQGTGSVFIINLPKRTVVKP
ncbi:MAG: GHKL domain-containing protein [Terrimonas sp.]|nr:GHKL domain-containing protein [Terrimonas sp.]